MSLSVPEVSDATPGMGSRWPTVTSRCESRHAPLAELGAVVLVVAREHIVDRAIEYELAFVEVEAT